MEPRLIFPLQMIWSLVCYALIARWYVAPRLARLPLTAALVAVSLPHLLRTVGLTFLVPGVTGGALPVAFAAPAAYGDLLTAVLALLAIVALRARWSFALGLVWVVNIVGAIDLLNALAQGARLDLASRDALGATWFIPTYIVPGLLVLHAIAFAQLITRARERRVPQTPAWAGQPA